MYIGSVVEELTSTDGPGRGHGLGGPPPRITEEQRKWALAEIAKAPRGKKGAQRIALAKVLGVHPNTLSYALKDRRTNEKTPGTDIPRGLDESLSPGGPRNTLGEDTSGVATPSESAISAPKAEGDAIHD